jgi:hypothetical protein
VRRPALPLALAAAAVLALAPAPHAAAQGRARLEIALPAAGQRAAEPPAIRSERVLSDSRTRDLLNHGFPARLHYRLELWSSDGWFDELRERVEWDVIVRQQPLDGTYLVARIVGDQVTRLGAFQSFRQVEETLAQPFQPPLRPGKRRDRLYYNVALDVEMLSVNDLDEVERWLRGELRPAVRGRRNPGTAVTRGLRALVVGLLGSENRHYEARSRTFVPE